MIIYLLSPYLLPPHLAPSTLSITESLNPQSLSIEKSFPLGDRAFVHSINLTLFFYYLRTLELLAGHGSEENRND